MSIEKEVGSDTFQNNYHKAIVNLYVTYSWHHAHLSELFKKYDLLSQHFNVLRILQGNYPNTCAIKDIKALMMDKSRDLTRLIDKLVDKGYVSRELNPENRRQMNICLTKEGLIISKSVNKALMAKLEDLNNLTDEEAIQLNLLLDKVRAPKKNK